MKPGIELVDARVRRWQFAAPAVAAWCMAWPAAMMVLGSDYPDLFPAVTRPGAGVYNLFQALTHRYAWLTLALIAAVAYVFTRALAAAGRRLDPECRVSRAVRWTLGSRLLNACSAACCFAVAMTEFTAAKFPSTFDRSLDWFGDHIAASLILVMAVWALVPFLVWNPVTLARPHLERWWVPGWPGWRPIAFAFALSMAILVLEGSEKIATEYAGLFPVPIWIAGSAATGLLSSLMTSYWIGGPDARWRNGVAHVRRAFPELAWAWLLAWLVEVMAAVPVLSIAITVIYFIPQYDAIARSHGQSLSPGLQFIAHLARVQALLWQVPLAGLAIYPNLFQGRLLSMRMRD